MNKFFTIVLVLAASGCAEMELKEEEVYDVTDAVVLPKEAGVAPIVVTAYCHGGDLLLSGGCSYEATGPNGEASMNSIHLHGSTPVTDTDSWRCTFDANSAMGITLTAVAHCMSTK